jgi:hypothetical protein
MNDQFAAPILIHEQVETILERLPLSGSSKINYNENWLQELLFKHPQTLPINEIDQSYLNLIPICREMKTPAGPVDVLYITPEGKLVILEAKLWQNPEARRKVIGQILDYAKELGMWSYEDLQREVSRALKPQTGQLHKLFDIVANKHPDLSEARFVDSVSRNLKRGEFLLLIVGDGIREGVAAIAEFLANHGTLHFTFGLVEMAIFKVNDKDLLVQPRVIAKTMIVKRTVITLESEGLVANDADEIEEESSIELSEIHKFYYEFWSEFIAGLKLDDPGQPLPIVRKKGNISLSTPAGGNAWITIYFSQKNSEVGVFLTFLRGSFGDMLYKQLLNDRETIDKELGMPVAWKSINGKHLIIAIKTFPDLKSSQYRESIKTFLADHANIFVNVFRPRIERIMKDV